MKPLLPSDHAPAMWALYIVLIGTPQTGRFRVKVEGPDYSVAVLQKASRDDSVVSEWFSTIDDATAAGLVAFSAVAGTQDILVSGGPHDDEWPICGPDDVLREAIALRERNLLTVWLASLQRYRQWMPAVDFKMTTVVLFRSGDERPTHRYIPCAVTKTQGDS